MRESGAGKYDSVMDEYLHHLVMQGASEEMGDVQSPIGYVWKIDLSDGDWLSERIIQECGHSHFIVREDSQGFITVASYPTDEAREVFWQLMLEQFNEWYDADPDE